MEWDDDEEIQAYIGKKGIADSQSGVWFESVRRDRRRVVLAIETDTGEFIGDLELKQIDWRNKRAELRICIGNKAYWGLGFGTDAIVGALQLAWERFGIKEVYLRVYCSNVRAIRCYQKCGFQKIGVLPAGKRRSRGLHDLLLMSCQTDRLASRLQAAQ
jgi:RimJ/RimL family protein N-acetyltransferase